MNFFKKLFSGVKRLFGLGKSWYVRLGLGQFLDKYIPVAVQIVADLAAANNNADFHAWKDQAFQEVKKATGEVKDNWVAILIHAAFELVKGANAAQKETV